MVARDNMNLLICGVPGGGKTFIGDQLELLHGFHHFDAEEEDFKIAKMLRNDTVGTIESMYGFSSVVTWGFDTYWGTPIIHDFIHCGFIPVWLDGDRAHFLSSFLKREGGSEYMELLFYRQMSGIIHARVKDSFPWILHNPFNPDGTFKPVNESLERILSSQERYHG